MGYRQCLPLSVVQLKSKHCQKPHSRNGVVDCSGYAKFSSTIIEMQQKSSLKYMILEKKITAMREELNVKEAQLHASGITGLY